MKPSLIRRTLLFFFVFTASIQINAQTFFGVSANPADNGSVTTNTITVTPPGSMVAGDLVIIYAHYDDNATLTITNPNSGGQTWNTEEAINNGTQSFAIFWCEYNGTWSANPTVSGGSGGTDPLTAVMYVFRPSNASNAWGIHIGATNTTDNTSAYAINGVTTTVPNTVTMAFWGCSDDNTWGTLTGTGWSKTGLSNQYRNTGGGDQSHTAAYNIQATAGTVNNVSQSASGDDFTYKSIVSWAEFPPPANNLCAGAITLTPSATCVTTNGTLAAATYTTLTNTCSFANNDVWYSFTAANVNQQITLGGTLGTNGRFQVFTAATCGGSETQVYCSSSNSELVTGLTPGQSYLVRVFSNNASSASFTICIVDPTPATIDYGKSYANISKINGGGTISPGDTLEIRATLVVRTQAVDSLSFIDTLSKGLNYVPGSIAIRTNEGKIYRWDNTDPSIPPVPFTDNFDSDAGYIYTSGPDSIIRINIGVGSTGTARGKVRQNTAPRIGSGASANSVIMATYRVVVDTSYSAILNLGGGYFTARDSANGTTSVMSFLPRSAVVYETPGLCPNSLSPTNTIADEFGGTFGDAVLSATSRPMKNRGTSANIPSYIYAPFAASAPNDYYYGVSNNTGAGGANYTAINTWPKSSNRRVHNVWDITGDHTGATNTAAGNPPCDTTQPVSPTNPCGYMLVVNSSYKTDTAFQYNINNLCPNTYYEISFWVKNICAKCGADSLGRWSGTASYLPTETGDSSGVRPNLAIDINGIDYYTTGQIRYEGTTLPQNLQDANNVWVKRGFTYLTSSTPGTLTMSVRNTAPGGGGNDWALDDISVATCYPNMAYSPSINPNVCQFNPLTIHDTVTSYFDNYVSYKWQRSTDGGTNWSDITGVTTLPNTNYYVTSYTIPPANTTLADSGDLYRVLVATTASNLTNPDCLISESAAISLSVTNCDPVLDINLLYLNGKLNNEFALLSWATTREDKPYTFILEKSTDEINFAPIATINGRNNSSLETNYYSFPDPVRTTGKTWYRLVMTDQRGAKKYSRIINLNNLSKEFEVGNIINPFNNKIYFDITTSRNTKIDVSLIDLSGRQVMKRSYTVYTGINSLSLENTGSLPQGVYAMHIEGNGMLISKKVIKKD